MILTTEILKQLKKATTISIHSNFALKTHTIRFDIKGVKSEIVLDCYGYDSYGGQVVEDKKAFVFFSNSDVIQELQSVLAIMKSGDQLGIFYRFNNFTDNLKALGITEDSFFLGFMRKGKMYKFLIRSEVAPITSTARMLHY